MRQAEFCRAVRRVARARGVCIITVGGLSGAGKSHMISALAAGLGEHRVAVCDLMPIRDEALARDPGRFRDLCALFGCVEAADAEVPAAVLAERLYATGESLLHYYAWLTALARPVVLDRLLRLPAEVRWFLLELVSPVDAMWPVGALHVGLWPPPRRIERQLMARERISMDLARKIRSAQEAAVAVLAGRGVRAPRGLTLDVGQPQCIMEFLTDACLWYRC